MTGPANESTTVDHHAVVLTDDIHPWHRWDDGRLWRSIYQVRSLMLTVFAAAAWAAGSLPVAIVVIAFVVPFNILVGRRHSESQYGGWLLCADQYLAGACTVINPAVALGVVISQLVGSVTGAMGARQRVVQPSIIAGGVLLFGGGLLHRDRNVMVFAVPATLSAMAIARIVEFLKNRNLTANRRYEELLDGINAFVCETDFDSGEVLYLNQRTKEMVGSGARTDQSLLEMVHPDDRRLATDTVLRARQSGEPVTSEVRVLVGDMTWHVEMRTTVSTKGSRRRVRTVLIDVSDRKRAELELAHLAVHDPLTDLPNRALLRERMRTMFAADRPALGAVLLLDLDNFKHVNDALGHASGDQLLIEVGHRLQKVAGADDTVARLGGDEFAVLLPQANERSAVACAQRVAATLAEPWTVRGVTITPKVSIGVALARADADDGETLLRHADMAMYECKRTAAGHVVYNAALEQLNEERLRLLIEDQAEPPSQPNL
jgi:diguanylate cyclase (GGDEF)-like protein/PAS domain S-box-containing protein